MHSVHGGPQVEAILRLFGKGHDAFSHSQFLNIIYSSSKSREYTFVAPAGVGHFDQMLLHEDDTALLKARVYGRQRETTWCRR
ncbi:unnamed protein product [Ilex paraguariensis]|uniref:Uncharacterized protein n=1 Tax=Ilex paraguariensis TaxID=185542 RepID=A0ABC8UQ39_9AQUA